MNTQRDDDDLSLWPTVPVLILMVVFFLVGLSGLADLLPWNS